MKNRLYEITVFVAVAEHQSFSKAARTLDLSAPAVTRAVGKLEERLGVRLLARSTRVVRLTDAGARYLEDCRRILGDLDEADEAVHGARTQPRGRLVVTASALFGAIYITPLLLEFLKRHPETTAHGLFLDRVVNLVDEGVDVAVRIGALPDSSLHAIAVGSVRRVLVAAPSYLSWAGTPGTVADLAHHSVIQATGIAPSAEWRFHGAGKPQAVRVVPRLVLTSNEAAIAAARAGWGLTLQLSYQVAAALRDGSLVAVLQDREPPPLPVHVLHAEGRRQSAKVRAFTDLLVERLRQDTSLR